jgi:hypothetical protein
MAISWLAPAALIGLSLIALPIAVHLLVRQPVRQWPFPSLRFLRETQLAALRRGRIEDRWLLLCRAAIVALAALAVAGPVLRTDARTAAFASRISRAVVVIESADAAELPAIRDGAFASATFTRANVADALGDAVRWLDAQPPSSREIVVTGLLRRAAIRDSDIALLPEDIGIRFRPIALRSEPQSSMSILARRNGALIKVDRPVRFAPDATAVTEGVASSLPANFVTIQAKPSDRKVADAALGAVLDAGVPWADFTTPVVIAWDGAEAVAAGNARIIRMPVPHPLSSSADAVMSMLIARSPRPVLREPVPIASEQLDAWSRPPRGVSPLAPIVDEGDRRWLWGAVLILLTIEWRFRRSRIPDTAAPEQEARVA